MQQARDPVKVCSRIGFALLAMLVIWQGSATVLQLIVSNGCPHLLMGDWTVWLLSSGPLYLLGMPAFLLILHFIPDGPRTPRWLPRFGLKHFLLAMVFSMGASYLILIVSTALITLLQQIFGGYTLSGADQLVNSGSMLSNVVFGVIVPAVGEEFLFRYMIRRKMRGCSDVQYIFFSGLCFGLFHGNVAQTLFTFVAGTIFAWAYLMTGRIWVPMAMHFVNNFISIVLFPHISASTALTVLFFLFEIGVMVGTIILFAGFKNWFFGSLQPPAEPGWPYRPWVPRRRSMTSLQYTAWYKSYARGISDRWKNKNSAFPQGGYPGQMMPPPYLQQPYVAGHQATPQTITLPPAGQPYGYPPPPPYAPQPVPNNPYAQAVPYAPQPPGWQAPVPRPHSYPPPQSHAWPGAQPQWNAPPPPLPQLANGTPTWTKESTVKVSLLNPGMILFLAAVLLVIILNLLTTVLF